MEIVVAYTARNLCFKRNCTISTGIPNLGVWCKNDPSGHTESDKKIRLRRPVLLVIRLHPKTSDSATLVQPSPLSLICCKNLITCAKEI